MGRREELAEAATDHVLEHGLIGLSLRPLGEALGTSDRMLLHYFSDKDDLVVSILRVTCVRSVAALRGLKPSRDLRSAVLDLWRATSKGHLQRCQRLYVEAAALGLLGQEPYASEVRESNAAWMKAVADHLTAAGASSGTEAAALVDVTFMGLQLDQPLETVAQQRRVVTDLAEAVADRWGRPG